MDVQEPNDNRPVSTLLRLHAAPRNQSVDDHMFTVGDGPAAGSFRLQLFTTPGRRPVAVVTQVAGEGASLINRSERYVEAAWKRHCPQEPQPPIWIARQLPGADSDFGFLHVQFTAIGAYAVASPPRWGPRLTLDELEELVGGQVDPDRGGGYIPRQAPIEPVMRFGPAVVAFLSRPNLSGKLEGEPACMLGGTPWWRRVGRQVVPRRYGQTCCWYHGGDWHEVSRIALHLLRQARAVEPDPDDLPFAALSLAQARGISGWPAEALESLLLDPIQPDRETGYINGRHRIQAMLDAGVRRTLVARWVNQRS